jgi:putative ABC transport system permease protein
MTPAGDLRRLARALRRSPGPAVAVWACTAIWMAVAPVLLSLLGSLEWKSFPFPESERLVQVSGGFDLRPALLASGRFAAVAAFEQGWLVAEGPGRAVPVVGAAVDPGFFAVFGIRPRSGRVFDAASVATDAEGAVLTESLARQLFGSGRRTADAVLRTGGRELAVLGVVPDRPVFPPAARLWVLRRSGAELDPAFLPTDASQAGMVGRLAPGTSLAAAQAALGSVAADFERRNHLLQGDLGIVPLASLLRRGVDGERGILKLSLAGLLAFVLLAQAGALSGFLVERERELAVRVALGARRGALLRPLAVQALALAVPGLALGLPAAVVLLRRLQDFVPPAMADLIPPTLEGQSVLLALGGWLTAAVASFLGAWLGLPRIGLGSVLVGEPSALPRTGRRVWARWGLVCAALSLVVALGAIAAMLQRSLANLERQPLGFEPRGAFTAVFRFAGAPAPGAHPARLRRLAEGVAALPGVAAVGFSDSRPFGDPPSSLEVSRLDRTEFWLARFRAVAGDYERAAGLERVGGRGFTRAEQETGAPVALLDREGGRRIFGAAMPVGQTVLLEGKPLLVVGVVAATRARADDRSTHPQIYVPLSYRRPGGGSLALVVRAGELRERDLEAAAATAGATVSQLRPLSAAVAASLSSRRRAQDLAAVQWLTALLLGAFATYGAVAWLLELRAREHAVRIALGDTRRGIARRTGRTVLGLMAISALLGLGLYLGASRVLRALFFGVEGLGPAAFLAAVLAALAAVMLAAAMATRAALARLSLDPLRGPGAPPF